MHNPKDMSRCHCGGSYELWVPTPAEAKSEAHRHPAVCRSCRVFRYLTEREAEMAVSARAFINRFRIKE